jgi:hypothetical protein
VPRFVPNSGTLQRIPVHERVEIRVLALQRPVTQGQDCRLNLRRSARRETIWRRGLDEKALQRFSQCENHATNNTLLILQHFYRTSPFKIQRPQQERFGDGLERLRQHH